MLRVALFPLLRCALGAPCRCQLLGAFVRVLPFLCCWSALVGRLSVMECAFWGSLLLFSLLHLFLVCYRDAMVNLQRDAIVGHA